MRRIFVGLVAVILLFCTSCQFSENIYVQEDGSVKVSFKLNADELMSMMGSQMPAEAQQKIDTTFSFNDALQLGNKELSKLSAEDRAKVQKLAPFSMQMQMDNDKGKANFDVYADLDNIEQLQDIFQSLASLDKLREVKNSPMSSLNLNNKSLMEYSFKNNTFKRKAMAVDQKMLDSLKNNLGQAQMLLASSTYKLNYHFPKKIKSVSLKDAKISEDGKSFTIETNCMNYIQDPKFLDFEVELEK